MNDFLKWLRIFPALLLAAPYIAVAVGFFWVCKLSVDKGRTLWLRYRYPKETTMNHLERRALAKARMAAHVKATAEGKPSPYVAKQVECTSRREASVIDRGLEAWW